MHSHMEKPPMNEYPEAEQEVSIVEESDVESTHDELAQNHDSVAVCPLEWSEGGGSCDRSCNLNHKIDFEKLNRFGFCFHEYFREGSCRHKQQCKYCHDIPESARHNPQIKQHVQAKIQRGRERKLSANPSQNAPLPPQNQAAPSLLNITTPYDQLNTNVENAPHLRR